VVIFLIAELKNVKDMKKKKQTYTDRYIDEDIDA
jgi:hypothetical protein